MSSMDLANLVDRLVQPPPRNVANGDLTARVFSLLVLGVLVAMMAAQSRLPHALVKLSLLIAAELGVISLMLGLFLRSNAYFAGLQGLAASLTMLWLWEHHQPWLACLAGLVVIAIGITNVATRRSRLNAVLALSSSPRLLDASNVKATNNPEESS